MTKYLARSCPRCYGYLGIVLRQPARHTPVQTINGECLECGYRLALILVQSRQLACRSALVGHHRMAKKRPDKVPPGPELDTLTAESIFGWKAVGEGAELLDQPRSRLRHRRTHEAAWTLGKVSQG